MICEVINEVNVTKQYFVYETSNQYFNILLTIYDRINTDVSLSVGDP